MQPSPELYKKLYELEKLKNQALEDLLKSCEQTITAMMWRQAVLSQGGVLLKFEAAGANISEINRRVK